MKYMNKSAMETEERHITLETMCRFNTAYAALRMHVQGRVPTQTQKRKMDKLELMIKQMEHLVKK